MRYAFSQEKSMWRYFFVYSLWCSAIFFADRAHCMAIQRHSLSERIYQIALTKEGGMLSQWEAIESDLEETPPSIISEKRALVRALTATKFILKARLSFTCSVSMGMSFLHDFCNRSQGFLSVPPGVIGVVGIIGNGILPTMRGLMIGLGLAASSVLMLISCIRCIAMLDDDPERIEPPIDQVITNIERMLIVMNQVPSENV